MPGPEILRDKALKELVDLCGHVEMSLFGAGRADGGHLRRAFRHRVGLLGGHPIFRRDSTRRRSIAGAVRSAAAGVPEMKADVGIRGLCVIAIEVAAVALPVRANAVDYDAIRQ